MTVVQTSTGSREQCDGCGRLDAGPGAELLIAEFTVHDPNIGAAVMHHYCVDCAARRHLIPADRIQTIPGWEAAALPSIGPGETQEQHDRAMQGEQVHELQEDERPRSRGR